MFKTCDSHIEAGEGMNCLGDAGPRPQQQHGGAAGVSGVIPQALHLTLLH